MFPPPVHLLYLGEIREDLSQPQSSMSASFGSSARTWRRRHARFPCLVAICTLILAGVVRSDPLCYADSSSPVLDATATFCANEEPEGFCCDAAEEAALQATLGDSGATGVCAALYQEVGDRKDSPKWRSQVPCSDTII